MPYTLLTGRYLWHNEAVAIFAGAGFLVSVGLVVVVRRRYFPNIGGGVMALAGEFEFHPARVEQVYFGANVIGGSTAVPKFSGRIVSLRRGD